MRPIHPDSNWVFPGRSGYPLHIRKAFDRAKRKAGLSRLVFHDFRRMFVTYTRGSGNLDRTVAAITGHKDYRVNDLYATPTDEQMRAVVESMPSIPTEMVQMEGGSDRIGPALAPRKAHDERTSADDPVEIPPASGAGCQGFKSLQAYQTSGSNYIDCQGDCVPLLRVCGVH